MAKIYKYTCLPKEFESGVKRYKAPDKRRCLECSIQRMRAATAQMMNKAGPFYEKWKKAVKRAARRL